MVYVLVFKDDNRASFSADSRLQLWHGRSARLAPLPVPVALELPAAVAADLQRASWR